MLKQLKEVNSYLKKKSIIGEIAQTVKVYGKSNGPVFETAS